MQKLQDGPINALKLLCEFEIKSLPPTINEIGRKHWAVKSNIAKRWIALVWHCCVLHKVAELDLLMARLELTRHSSRECDFDNLASSFKHVIDGLVRARVIRDDKPSIIGSPVFKWEKAKKGQGKITVKVFTLGTQSPKGSD